MPDRIVAPTGRSAAAGESVDPDVQGGSGGSGAAMVGAAAAACADSNGVATTPDAAAVTVGKVSTPAMPGVDAMVGEGLNGIAVMPDMAAVTTERAAIPAPAPVPPPPTTPAPARAPAPACCSIRASSAAALRDLGGKLPRAAASGQASSVARRAPGRRRAG
ncbi:unnamed protein product [Prorocentrum cordatum]|uniref:Uncharacterized protein n=1 Tax=Prorocentrum cordatum TaxID=2364126 RepID=A0ABN9YHA3_9DINO|nr:unnamed protein product [Polarella glacialis]